jgi:hypothetical protein
MTGESMGGVSRPLMRRGGDALHITVGSYLP